VAESLVAAPLVTGLVLAGGRGSRLGGVDKGLQPWQGEPLAARALRRLAPQVSALMVSANRHLEDYARLGVPVWPDPPEWTGHQGPLAGMLAGLRHVTTPWMVTVPCDCPSFPADLVARLLAQVGDHALCLARSPAGPEPAFCLMRREVEASLADSLARGERSIERWARGLPRSEAQFDDAGAFFNINTPDDLARA
jgi:molybdenum cofactor guanylyltransferase